MADLVGGLLSATLSIPSVVDPRRAIILAERNRTMRKQVNSPGALVIEDPPNDSSLRTRLNFQSYPDTIDEVYTLVQYREIAATRMSQPGFVAYRGGNWGDFPLELEFRAGMYSSDDSGSNPGSGFEFNNPFADSPDFDSPQMKQLLIDNEINVRWCQALAFPLARGIGATAQTQIIGSKVTAGASASELSVAGAAIANLRRYDPPIILVQFGSWLTIRGYVKNVAIQWQRPFHPVSGRAYGAKVNFNFQPIMPFYPNFQSIAAQSGDQEYVARTNRLRAAADAKAKEGVNEQNNLNSVSGGGV